MKRRNLLCVAAALLVVMGGFILIVWWTAPTHRINLTSFKQIKSGMTLDEVVQIVGVRPGQYGSPPKQLSMTHLLAMPVSPGLENEIPHPAGTAEWLSEAGNLKLVLAQDQKVLVGEFEEPVTILYRLRRWLGLL